MGQQERHRARGDTMLGHRQAPNSHLGIPEGHLPGTGQMAPRSWVGEFGEQGRGKQGFGGPEWADIAWMGDTGSR